MTISLRLNSAESDLIKKYAELKMCIRDRVCGAHTYIMRMPHGLFKPAQAKQKTSSDRKHPLIRIRNEGVLI